MSLSIADLPLTATIEQTARVFGFTCGQVRTLINSKKIAYIRIGSRFMIPRDAIERYLQENTVQPCHDETPARVFASSKSGNVSTSSGPMADAAASAQRALRTASSLKPRSPTSSTSGPVTQARVTLLRSS
jgi:excisionase family DNA binding protein